MRDVNPTSPTIPRDFVERVGDRDPVHFDRVERIALTAAQVTEYDLPPALGKTTDSRASQFVAKYGQLVQVELDALPPDVLQALFSDALSEFWDMSAYEAVVEREADEAEELHA